MRNLWGFLGLSKPAGSAPAAPSAINKSIGDFNGGSVVLITVASSVGLTGAKVCGVPLTSFSAPDSTHVQGTTGPMTASATPGAVVVTNASGDSSPLASAYEAFDVTNISSSWFDLLASSGFTISGTGATTVATWIDRANGNVFASLPAAFWPTLGSVGGVAAIVAIGANSETVQCSTLGSPANAEVYRIAKNSNATDYQQADSFGTGPGMFLPYVDGSINDNFGSTTRYASAGGFLTTLATLYCYSRRVAASGTWDAYLNGTHVITETGNTVSWANPVLIGDIGSNGSGTTSVLRQFGWQKILSSGERARVAAWMLDHYGATL